MKMLSVMIKPASSRCNLQCRYCFYADVSQRRAVPDYGIMRRETAEKVVANIYSDLSDGDVLNIGFQGGEPTLAGLDFFKSFAELVANQPKKVTVHWALQTNGTTLDAAWCAFLKEHRFLVGLSLDGAAAAHNANRIDRQGKGSFSRVLQSKRLLEQAGVDYNVLCVLTDEAARHPQTIWNFLLREKIRFVQFIPCLEDLGADEPGRWALTPKNFSGFYSALFRLWKKELLGGNYISVKFFDDVANLFLRRAVTACGMIGRCQCQNVVEADGSVYPCDFYVLDAYRLGSLAEMPLREVFDRAQASGFLDPDPAPPEPCAACAYRAVCNGGCKRMRRAQYIDPDGLCGYKQFLDDCLQELTQIVGHFTG